MSEQQEAVVPAEESREELLLVADIQEDLAQPGPETDTAEDQDLLDDLGEIEFLLDEIEDQIAPLAR